MRAVLRLRLDLADGRTADARTALAMLEAQDAGIGRLQPVRVAECYVVLHELDQAMAWIDRALAGDPENWQALALAARVHLRKRRPERALDAAVASLSLVYHQPVIHFVMGRALVARGDTVRAESALLTAIAQMPGLVPAHNALARLYLRKLGRPADALHHRNIAAGLRFRQSKATPSQATPSSAAAPASPERVPAVTIPFVHRDGPGADPARDVVVVAGLPRSGTSMLMQLLHAGGVPVLTDGLRVADSDNPLGYFEYEPATRLATDASWLALARGKVVKLALPLVRYLPAGESYRLLIIERDLAEVIASQRKMLDRLDRSGASVGPEILAAEYVRQREQVRRWLERRPEVAVLPLNYAEILADPRRAAETIGAFLGRPFADASAAAAVDPSLRRQGATFDPVSNS